MNLVKSNFIALILLVLSVNSFAQDQASVIGIKGGFTSSSIYGGDIRDSLSPGGNSSNLNGFNLGLSVNSMPGKHIWLKHDLLLVQKGAVIKPDDKTGPYDSKLRLLYIDIYPISPAFHFKGFQVFAGPYMGLLLNGTAQRKDSTGNLITDKSVFGSSHKTNNYLQKIDLGFVAGVEYEFDFGLNIGIRYVQGFVPIIENALIQRHQPRIYNRNLNLSLGYTFGRKKK